MTLRQSILRSLNGLQFAVNNSELAQHLGAPEPSVRRMTRKLTEEGLLERYSSGQFIDTPPFSYVLTAAGKPATTQQRSGGCGCGQ